MNLVLDVVTGRGLPIGIESADNMLHKQCCLMCLVPNSTPGINAGCMTVGKAYRDAAYRTHGSA